MPPLPAAAIPIIAEGAGALFGIGQGALNDARQVRQQRKLNRENARYNKEMTAWNMEKQMELWERTGYGATKDQMKRAGLNPALLYGMSGAGGQSTGVNTSNQSAATAPSGGGEMAGGAAIGIQNALAASTIRLQESQANKNNADAAATSGYKQDEARQGIDESKAKVEAILQGVDNARIQHDKMVIERAMLEMSRYEQGASQEDRLSQIEWNAKQAIEATKRALNENYITSKTIPERIKIVQQAAIEAVLRNEAIKKGTALDEQKIKESANNILMNWDKLERNDQEIMLKKVMTDFNSDLSNDVFRGAMGAFDEILKGKIR